MNGSPDTADDFTSWPDLASRSLYGSVCAANDELFAERENLIKPGPAAHTVGEFGNKGKTYDGWETRRRREPGVDWAVVRLGAAGIVRGVVVDTAFFRGNYPPEISVEATSVEGYPAVDDLLAMPWETIVPRSPALGDTQNRYTVKDPHRWTHVRLTIYPDGGVARLRVHGEVVPDPRYLTGTVDLVALENGGRLVGCSDAFYSTPQNIIQPGRARVMGEGWENARRRGPGNDWATFRLAVPGIVRHVEVDTSYFVGNAPGWVSLSTANLAGAAGAGESRDPDADTVWTPILERTAVQPDTRHRYLVAVPPVAVPPVGVPPVAASAGSRGAAETDVSAAAAAKIATHVRLDVYPDGGLSRLRIFGDLPPASLGDARRRWWNSLPEHHRESVPELAPPEPGSVDPRRAHRDR